MESDDMSNIIAALQELYDDRTVPKNVRNKLNNIIEILKGPNETSIKINKALDELDDIQSDANLQPYTRTQIFNITSLLETV